MIVYSATKREFLDDVHNNRITSLVENEVRRKLNRNSPINEVRSWENSLRYMSSVLELGKKIPESSGVAIEYNLPLTNRRVDFILTGKDQNYRDSAVIIELKQWDEVQKTNKDAIVITRFQHGEVETNHPSYQAWSYTALIEDYNETVRKEEIRLQPCAYLHNMLSNEAINDPFYQYHTNKAPVFISPDAAKLAAFLEKFVRYGDSDNIMYRIEHGVIKPSKNLADSLSSMLEGNQEFLMIDNQKLVYETALDLAYKAKNNNEKHTLIVKGGPGTGKSVVAINLLVELTKREMLVQYVSKNAAPREVFTKRLRGTKKKSQIDQMFKGSGSYTSVEPSLFDALLIDEAHRLNKKSGLFSNLGENQIKELIQSSKFNVFFIDEAQRVTLKDIGSVEEILKWAKVLDSQVTELELISQFRCNGSDGYLAWVDHNLQIRETANPTLDSIDYEVVVFDDPNELREAIYEKNRLHNRARMVAGYCWDWVSRKDSSQPDIVIPEFGFEAQWNLKEDGSLWLIAENSVEQIGCIHTCQGLELDYVGVIIGDDFVIRDGIAITDATKRSPHDYTIRGFKGMFKKDPENTKKLTSEIIKNTYRTLMTRGQKGCYIFCTDEETREYFVEAAQRTHGELMQETSPFSGLSLNIVDYSELNNSNNCVPVFNAYAAAGDFSKVQSPTEVMWVELPSYIKASPDMFVMQVTGESMNKAIPNGAWCLFRFNPKGTRNGKIVLAQHRNIEDPDNGGSYTVKIYKSVKKEENETLVTTQVILKPKTNSYNYQPIIIDSDTEDVLIIAEFLAIISQ